MGILAVDLGLRTGLAYFDDEGRLAWFRAQNMGSVPRLKRAIPAVLRRGRRRSTTR